MTFPRFLLLGAGLALALAGGAALAGSDERDRHDGYGLGGLDFEGIDANGDGALGRDELVARATARLAATDANGDGTLERSELAAAMPQRVPPGMALYHPFAADPGTVFANRILDEMDRAEAGQVAVTALAGARADEMLEHFDVDEDGSIAEAEVEAVQDRDDEGGGRHGRDGRDSDD